MSYWWMNTAPSEWDIFAEMSPGDTEPWDARDDVGKYKSYMKQVRPGHRGLCYQNGESAKLVAELKADTSLVSKNGKDTVSFRLESFLRPVPWSLIKHSHIIPDKHLNVIRRSTLFPLTKDQYERLIRLSEHNGYGEQRDQAEQDELARSESKLDLPRIREELRSLKATDSEQIEFKGKRYKRDNQTIARLKILRGYKCQICGSGIRRKDGSHYIEAAHITPKRDKGPELPINIIILCPNHHKEFDVGEKDILERNAGVLRIKLNASEYSVDLRF